MTTIPFKTFVYSLFKDDERRRAKVDPSSCWNPGEYPSLPGSSIHQSTGEGLLPAPGANSNLPPDLEAGVFIFFTNFNHLPPSPRIWGTLFACTNFGGKSIISIAKHYKNGRKHLLVQTPPLSRVIFENKQPLSWNRRLFCFVPQIWFTAMFLSSPGRNIIQIIVHRVEILVF